MEFDGLYNLIRNFYLSFNGFFDDYWNYFEFLKFNSFFGSCKNIFFFLMDNFFEWLWLSGEYNGM